MPRADRTKSRLHTSAVSLPSKLRSEPVPAPIADTPDAFTTFPDEPSASTSRSQSQRKAYFVAAVQSAPHPYLIKSKSHIRREKRKAKSLSASTNLESLENALSSILPEPETKVSDEEEERVKVGVQKKRKKTKEKIEEEKRRIADKKREEGKISEGRGRTLNEKKRRDVIQEASKRIPAVLSHPAYKSNPWAAIREHAGNSIATVSKTPSVKR
uniref:Ribosome biogenesis protein SLX9 n=1 Tax=Kwoniella dejecticola CBS 10117 TaxID=1296121 RepID=A0A1A6A134_9TREE|nr:uncharacterized protein I303_06056 [Kwoniella dejecticola CBS 10117]OBR83774.1 hypothetical protein I303_06056 [Kwoniella dejecticola CBS 10117]